MTNVLKDSECRLVMNALPHLGPVSMRRLLDAFGGDPTRLLSADRKAIVAVEGIGPTVADTLANWPRHFDLEREQALMRTHQVRFIDATSDDYPTLLAKTYDPPIGLYWKGDYCVAEPCIAIVGTRRATLYGAAVAKQLAGQLARMGFCIVSGMARGTDTAAHEGALDAGGRTVAVLGCGIDIIYPPENVALYRRLAESGAVASEFPFGRRADRQTFPMRNRVVAGMSQAVIVIESDRSGGSMITARFAAEQGRHVMAVPGRIDQAASRGCHQLIRDGAVLVTSVEDILAELDYRQGSLELDMETAMQRTRISLTDEEARVLEALEDGAALSQDAILACCGLTAAAVGPLLTALELKGCVQKRGDGLFEKRMG